MMSWYVAPELTSSDNFQSALKSEEFHTNFVEGLKNCALAMPFMGKGMTADYTKLTFGGLFYAQEKSGLFCSCPL